MQEWEAYEKLDPIGEWREDFRMAYLAQIVTNLSIAVHGKKGAQFIDLVDFMPDWLGEGKPQRKQSAEEIKKFLTEFAKGQNKAVGNQTWERLKKRKARNEHRNADSNTGGRHLPVKHGKNSTG